MATGYNWNDPINKERYNLAEGENLIYRTGQAGAGVGTARMAADEARRFEQDMATGRLSQAQTQLQQGLGQSRRQQAAMAAGGGAMGQRAAMLAGGEAGAQVAGQAARIRAQEETAAREQSMGALGQAASAEANLEKLRTMQSVAQSQAHAAQQAENRAQAEADRAFGLEVLGALAGGVSAAGSLGSMSPGPLNPDGSYKNPEIYGYPAGYTQAQHLSQALTSNRPNPSPMAQAMSSGGGFDVGFASPEPQPPRLAQAAPSAMQGPEYERSLARATEYVPESMARSAENVSLGNLFGDRSMAGGPRPANLQMRPAPGDVVAHGSPELRKQMYLATGQEVPPERTVPLPDQTLEMQGASPATPSPMVRMKDGSLREVRTDEGLPEPEVTEEEQKASLELFAEDDDEEEGVSQKKATGVKDEDILSPMGNTPQPKARKGVTGSFARGQKLGKSLVKEGASLANKIQSSMYKKTPSETNQKRPETLTPSELSMLQESRQPLLRGPVKTPGPAEMYGFREPPPQAVDDTLRNLRAYDYTYKSDDALPPKARGMGLEQMGSRRGPMAEELRATPLGEKAVVSGPSGDMIDNNNYLYGVVTPGLTRVNDKVEFLARKLEEYDQMLRRGVAERGK